MNESLKDWNAGGWVRVDFAKKLEQERDEARTTIEDAKRALNATDYEGILLAAMRVKEERDEARKVIQNVVRAGQVGQKWQSYAIAFLEKLEEAK